METPEYFLFQKNTLDYFWSGNSLLDFTEFTLVSVYGFGAKLDLKDVTSIPIFNTAERILQAIITSAFQGTTRFII